MNANELKEKVLCPEFQYKCWRVLADILEDKHKIKIKVLGIKKELAGTSSSK